MVLVLLKKRSQPIAHTWPDRLQIDLPEDLLLLDALAQCCQCCCMLLQAGKQCDSMYRVLFALQHGFSSTLTAAGDTSELGWLMPEL